MGGFMLRESLNNLQGINNLIGSGFDLYKGIRDDQQQQADREQAKIDLAQFQRDPAYTPDYSKYSDPAQAERIGTYLKGQRGFAQEQQAIPVLDQFKKQYSDLAGPNAERFYADPASRQVLAENGLQVPDSTTNPVIRKGLEEFTQKGQLQNDLADYYAGSGSADTMARIASNPTAQAQHNILSVLDTTRAREATRADAEAKTAEALQKEQNLSEFQGAIAGLTGRSTSPADLARFAKNGGFAPFSDVEGDIRQAAQAYGVGSSPEVNKSITEARGAYEKTYLPQETVQVGRTTATGQRNLLGDFRKDATSTAPVVKVSVGGPGKAPSGYRYTATGDLEAIPGGPATRVRPGKPLPSSAVDFFADTPMMIQNLREAQGIAPRVSTGPVVGRVQNIVSKFDGATDDFVNLQQRFATVNNIMLKARSGAAVTEQEYTRFMKEMPTENDPPRKMGIKLNNAIKYAEKLVERKRAEYARAGYQVGDEATVKSPAAESSPATPAAVTGKVGKYSYKVK